LMLFFPACSPPQQLMVLHPEDGDVRNATDRVNDGRSASI